MKSKSKMLVRSFCLVLVLFLVLSVTVFAQSSVKNGIEIYLSTDKTDYSKDEDIKVNIVVKNTTLDPIVDVVLTPYLPEGFKVLEGANDASSIGIIDIDRCSVKEIKLLYVGMQEPASSSSMPTSSSTPESIPDSSSGQPASGPVPTNSPKTGDGILTLAIFILGAGVVLLAVLLFIKSKNKKASKMMALLLVGAALSAAVMQPVLVRGAVVDEDIESIAVYQTITIDNKEFSIGVKVEYRVEEPVSDTGKDELEKDEIISSSDTKPVGVHGIVKYKDEQTDIPLQAVMVRLREGASNTEGEYVKDKNGNTLGIVSDIDGKFLLEVEEGKGKTYTIEFSCDGYKTTYVNGLLQENHYLYVLMDKA